MLTRTAMKRRPTSPGEMLLEEFLKPAGSTQVALAEKMGVPIQRVNGIIAGRRAVTAESAILLSRALGTTPDLWLNLQVAVDLWDAEQRLRGRPRLAVSVSTFFDSVLRALFEGPLLVPAYFRDPPAPPARSRPPLRRWRGWRSAVITADGISHRPHLPPRAGHDAGPDTRSAPP